ncbi:MAG: Ribosomal RNA small subunit methyltransferase H [Parcubacteria bacterium OLB19]|nr:MAG: Ribosomal RNA small subunit methyltransferase H [Parcubacteria bacterium OLB19]
MKHITVLQTEAVEALALNKNSVVVDATYGGGGHAKLICGQLGKQGVYVGIDADKTAFRDNPLELKKNAPTIHLINDNFSNLNTILSSLNIEKVDAILADLGWRTDQFTDGGKGFSFQAEEPLLMTFGESNDYLFTAYDIVNGWSEEDIANVIYGYGEERYARKIARAIAVSRKIKPIATAKELAEIVEKVVPRRSFKKTIHPATKTFQALRIAVNDELKVLENFIDKAVEALALNGRLAIISFHSIEDRIVKLKFRELVDNGLFVLVNKKPITASDDELQNNPRARSAKLRIISRVNTE